ncbi:MAG: class II aldolase/adducin family protein, partial [Candidatus Cloacimonetes bacterium]|nr:class II aldolase/adducin family protein [Candidatus Cloacimonadota bacterium]
ILPELYIYLPEGIAFANYAPPGSERLRDESLKVLANKKVIIWEKHGILAFGKDLDEAFDYLEIVNKVAGIYLKLR